MKNTDPSVSEYMRKIQALRKNKVGGFSDPEVLAKALAKRKENAEKQKKKISNFTEAS